MLTALQRAYLAAIIDAGGHMAHAARAMSVNPPSVSQMLRYVVEKTGHAMPPRDLSRLDSMKARVDLCREILREDGHPRPAPPPIEVPPSILQAICHPDRPTFSKRLCRQCYREQMERSRVSGAAIDEARALRRQRILDGVTQRDAHDDVGKPLTESHVELLRVMATGMTNKEAAVKIGVSEQTIKNHLTAIYNRLGARNLTDAFARLGWLTVPGETRDERAVRDVGEARAAIHRAILRLGAAASALEEVA